MASPRPRSPSKKLPPSKQQRCKRLAFGIPYIKDVRSGKRWYQYLTVRRFSVWYEKDGTERWRRWKGNFHLYNLDTGRVLTGWWRYLELAPSCEITFDHVNPKDQEIRGSPSWKAAH